MLSFGWSQHVLMSHYQSVGDSTKRTNYIWYHRHFYVPQFFFNSIARTRNLSFFFFFFRFLLILLSGLPGQQSPQFDNFSIRYWVSSSVFVWLRLGDPFVHQNPWELCASHSPGHILGCAYTFCLLLLLLLIRVFHISVSWWSFTGVWVAASLLKSPGLFSVFWPFSIMLLFGWSPLGRQLLNLPDPLIIL